MMTIKKVCFKQKNKLKALMIALKSSKVKIQRQANLNKENGEQSLIQIAKDANVSSGI